MIRKEVVLSGLVSFAIYWLYMNPPYEKPTIIVPETVLSSHILAEGNKTGQMEAELLIRSFRELIVNAKMHTVVNDSSPFNRCGFKKIFIVFISNFFILT